MNPRLDWILTMPTSGGVIEGYCEDEHRCASTIHQPSSEVFFLFDQVIFLKAGRVFYQGPTSNLVPRFDKLAVPSKLQPCRPCDEYVAKAECGGVRGEGIFMQNFSDGDFA